MGAGESGSGGDPASRKMQHMFTQGQMQGVRSHGLYGKRQLS